MFVRSAARSPAEDPIGKPWAVALLSEDLELGRRLARALAHDDFRFTCAHPQATDRFAGGWSTFDQILFYVCRERTDGSMPKDSLHRHRGCVVVLGYAASGMERAWWIDNGADDCLSHPCDKHELLARLRALIRRRHASGEPLQPLTVGALTIWLRERVARLGGRTLALTTCEFSLLAVLAKHAGEVLGREQLLEFAKGSAEQAFDRAIDVQISRLRVKLRDNSREPKLLKTVRGAGYVLVTSPAACAAPVADSSTGVDSFQNVSAAKARLAK